MSLPILLGTCSICGGPVSLINGHTSCGRCAAVPEHQYGRLIPMRPVSNITYGACVIRSGEATSFRCIRGTYGCTQDHSR